MNFEKEDSFPLLPYLTLKFEQENLPEGDSKFLPRKFFFLSSSSSSVSQINFTNFFEKKYF